MDTRGRRRIAATLLAASVGALTLAGCGSDPGAGPGRTTVRVAMQDSLESIWTDTLVKDFEIAHPDITVDMEFSPTAALSQTLLTQLQSGSGPDVFYSNGGTGQTTSVLTLAAAHRLADLSTLPFAASLPDSAAPLYQAGGRTYGLPLAQVPVGVVYNTDVFAAHGVAVPTTFDQLLTACSTLRAAGIAPFALAGSAAANAGLLGQVMASSFVYSAAPTWNTDRTAKSTTFATSPGWTGTLDAVTRMNTARCFQDGAAGAAVPAIFSAVGSGRAGMLVGPGAAVSSVQKVAPQVKLGMFPFPAPTADATRATMALSDALAVNAAPPHLGAAKQFVDFISQKQQAAAYATAAGALTITGGDANLPPALSAFAPYLKDGKVAALPNLGWPKGTTYDTFGQSITGLLTGQTTTPQTLTALDAAWDRSGG